MTSLSFSKYIHTYIHTYIFVTEIAKNSFKDRTSVTFCCENKNLNFTVKMFC